MNNRIIACFLSLFLFISFALIIKSEKCSIVHIEDYLFPKMTVYVEVLDDQGTSIFDLTAQNFRVIEDGKEIRNLEISFIYRNKEWFDIILGIDRSGSMKDGLLSSAKLAALDFVNNLSVADRVALVTYDDKIDLSFDFIRDKKIIREKIKSIQTRANTSLYDALADAIGRIKNTNSPRKALIFFTDGKDTSSKISIDDLIDKLTKSAIPCFIIGIGDDINELALQKITSSKKQEYILNPDSKSINNIHALLAKKFGVQYLIKYKSQALTSRAIHRLKLQYVKKNKIFSDIRYFSIH